MWSIESDRSGLTINTSQNVMLIRGEGRINLGKDPGESLHFRDVVRRFQEKCTWTLAVGDKNIEANLQIQSIPSPHLALELRWPLETLTIVESALGRLLTSAEMRYMIMLPLPVFHTAEPSPEFPMSVVQFNAGAVYHLPCTAAYPTFSVGFPALEDGEFAADF